MMDLGIVILAVDLVLKHTWNCSRVHLTPSYE